VLFVFGWVDICIYAICLRLCCRCRCSSYYPYNVYSALEGYGFPVIDSLHMLSLRPREIGPPSLGPCVPRTVCFRWISWVEMH